MRKLASLQVIEEIKNIEGADAIDAYRVLGWWVVDRKGAYQIGDLVIYCEIDSWMPHELAAFLTKNAAIPREYMGIAGERLKTIKLRGQVSQGLLLPISSLYSHGNFFMNEEDGGLFVGFKTYDDGSPTIVLNKIGSDATDYLGIVKWEAPIPSQLQGRVKGTFPTSLISKTDQERIQNCFADITSHPEYTYEVSIKLDGSSLTIFRFEDELRVCSRNMELKISEENSSNSFVKMAMLFGDRIPEGLALQGELMGESIQGNRENIKGHKFFVFDVFDIKTHEYLSPSDRRKLCIDLEFDHVPVLETFAKPPESVAEALMFAEGPSLYHKTREGLVYKSNENPQFSFKIISNKFLLSEK